MISSAMQGNHFGYVEPIGRLNIFLRPNDWQRLLLGLWGMRSKVY